MNDDAMIPMERVERAILLIRGQKVLLDADLADLYGVETKALNQAVRRNPERFPPDFMFRLEEEEWAALRSQSVTSKGRGGRRTAPYVFTEQGVAMLSSVLHSERAVRVNIAIMRAFVQLRRVLATHEDLARQLAELGAHVGTRLDDHDRKIEAIFDALRRMVAPGTPARRKIGFDMDKSD